jgi:D-alanyl-D-alanine carboxypeptidase/D-alanyl-D-alanine-endopeptidase (penicillin-binding protein 4)
VGDPARFAAAVFAEVLEKRGVLVMRGVATSSDPLDARTRVLAAHEGAPMARLLEEVNKESQNLHAELLLRLVGRRVLGEGTTEKGREAVESFLDRLEVRRAGWQLVDGSGLSHTNALTPRGLVSLLAAMDVHEQADVFRSSLAVAGVDGKLEDRMVGTRAQARVRAKTGALQGVSALAGYVTTDGGARLAFAILLNGHGDLASTARAAIDDIAITLATTR